MLVRKSGNPEYGNLPARTNIIVPWLRMRFLFYRGPDLDDDDDDSGGGAKPGPSNGHVKPKTKQQKAGEQLLKHILDRVDGGSYSFRYTRPRFRTNIWR